MPKLSILEVRLKEIFTSVCELNCQLRGSVRLLSLKAAHYRSRQIDQTTYRNRDWKWKKSQLLVIHHKRWTQQSSWTQNNQHAWGQINRKCVKINFSLQTRASLAFLRYLDRHFIACFWTIFIFFEHFSRISNPGGLTDRLFYGQFVAFYGLHFVISFVFYFREEKKFKQLSAAGRSQSLWFGGILFASPSTTMLSLINRFAANL